MTATIMTRMNAVATRRRLGSLRVCAQVLGSVADGIRAARECKTLTDRGVAPSDAVREVFDRVRAN